MALGIFPFFCFCFVLFSPAQTDCWDQHGLIVDLFVISPLAQLCFLRAGRIKKVSRDPVGLQFSIAPPILSGEGAEKWMQVRRSESHVTG